MTSVIELRFLPVGNDRASPSNYSIILPVLMLVDVRVGELCPAHHVRKSDAFPVRKPAD